MFLSLLHSLKNFVGHPEFSFVLFYLSLGELSLRLAPYLFSVSAIYSLLLLDLNLDLFLFAECFILVLHFYCIHSPVFTML